MHVYIAIYESTDKVHRKECPAVLMLTMGPQPSRFSTECRCVLHTAMRRMSRTMAGECGTMASTSVLETTRAAKQQGTQLRQLGQLGPQHKNPNYGTAVAASRARVMAQRLKMSLWAG